MVLNNGHVLKIFKNRIFNNYVQINQFKKHLELNGSVKNVKHDPITITACYSQLTHHDETMKTANAFIYALDNKRYLVTTAHLLFDSWKSTDSELPTVIKSMKQELNNYWYSRFFDVTVFDVTDNEKFNNVKSINNVVSKSPKKIHVSYMDSQSGDIFEVDANYTKLVSSHIKLGAIGHKLNAGSSGSAVLDSDGNLVGIVTCCGDTYDNITLVIPASTVLKIIKTGNSTKPNYDENNKIYPKLLTQPLQKGHMEFLDIDNGELVLQSVSDKILPFDIVTHVNGELVGKENKLSSIALDNQDKLKLTIHKLKPEWRDLYGALPRKIYNEFKIILYEDEFDVNKNKLTIKKELDLNFLKKGMSIKLKLSDSEIKFVYVADVDYTDKIITFKQDLPNNLSVVTLFSLASVYTNLPNDFENIKEVDATIVNDDNKMNNIVYKKNIIYFLIKHWAYLVCSSLTNLPWGHQHIVWAKMIQQLFKIFYDFKIDYAIILINIIYKSFEFNDINSMNLLNIVIQNMYDPNTSIDRYNDEMNYIKSVFPFLDNANVLQSNLNNLGIKINYDLSEIDDINVYDVVETNDYKFIINETKDDYFVVKMLRGTIYDGDIIEINDHEIEVKNSEDVFLEDLLNGNSTFNLDGLSAEHYHNKNTVSKAKPRQINSDNVNLEIELVLKEIEKVVAKEFKDDELYYPSSLGILQSFWDHSHLTLAGIMSTLNGDSFTSESEKVELVKLPKHLSTWNYNHCLDRGAWGPCWICTYLHRKGMLTDQEYEKFNKFGLYAFKHHSKTLKGYWSYLGNLMEHFSKIAEEKDWDHFKPWAKETLEMIDNGEMEDAYINFCKKVVYLTENYNKDYQMFNDKQVDVYTGVYNMFN